MMERPINDNRLHERGVDAEFMEASDVLHKAVDHLRTRGFPRYEITTAFFYEVERMLEGATYKDEGGYLADIEVLKGLRTGLSAHIETCRRAIERIRAERADRTSS